MNEQQQIGGTHYQDLGIEPLEVMRSWFGKEGYEAYLLGNVIKYMARYPKKCGKEDLLKAQHYLRLFLKDKEDELAVTPNVEILPGTVARSWIGDAAYEAHLRADVVEYLGYCCGTDDFSWAFAALGRLEKLINLL